MLETTSSLQFVRSHGEDRWLYRAAKARRNPQQHNRGQRGAGTGYRAIPATDSKKAGEVPENRERAASSCNLDRFLEFTSLSAPAQYSPKTRVREWRNGELEESQPYFALVDLWESFRECSAYGAGVPLILNGSERVVQYYVPYLSGIQLYGDSNYPSMDNGQFGESDGDSYRYSSSDRSSDCEHEEALKYSRVLNSNLNHGASNVKMNGFSLRKRDVPDGFTSDGDSENPHGYLLFEYLEQDPPFIREPLADKIADLAQQFPVLRALRSCDLLQSSWISVAWYPIYRIPTGPTLKDLDACFLTFHPLSTRMKGASDPIITYPKGVDAAPKVSLPTFGLACYKFKSSIWTPNGRSELQRASSLLQVADNWLKHLNVDHPDYRFFLSHGAYQRQIQGII